MKLKINTENLNSSNKDILFNSSTVYTKSHDAPKPKFRLNFQYFSTENLCKFSFKCLRNFENIPANSPGEDCQVPLDKLASHLNTSF